MIAPTGFSKRPSPAPNFSAVMCVKRLTGRSFASCLCLQNVVKPAAQGRVTRRSLQALLVGFRRFIVPRLCANIVSVVISILNSKDEFTYVRTKEKSPAYLPMKWPARREATSLFPVGCDEETKKPHNNSPPPSLKMTTEAGHGFDEFVSRATAHVQKCSPLELVQSSPLAGEALGP